ncbi:cingulin [Xenopus laevis]|uniref:Cingulin n=1 Tax=Xenopus laevis TaxID=8355 RepID=CING_XENLA|nr:cingulin [Xenopus laevis]Q9PTD7.3 RecName: Full=Cingulin [Xenopus laevis]AAF20208.1 cingulin [Xenopus laevis]
MERDIYGDMADQHIPVGQGVQIRFIGDLKENGKPRGKRSKQDSYGVAVRVQGIDGQPFVVLNSGDKAKSSFGVQIKSQEPYLNASNTSPPNYQNYSSKPRGPSRSISSESELPENPYGSRGYRPSSSHYSSASDEEQKPRGNIRGSDGLSSLPRPLQASRREELRRSQSHSSLLEPDVEESYDYDHHYSERSSTLDTTYSQSSRDSAWSRSSQKKIDNGDYPSLGYRSATSQQSTSVSNKTKKNGLSTSSPSNQSNEDIDTKPLSSVDSLINKFDIKGQVRGRTARRSQALKDERKRSQSLDGRKNYHDTADSREIIVEKQNEVQTMREPVNASNRSFNRQTLERGDISKTRLTKEWLDQDREEPVILKQQRTVQSEFQLKSTPDLLRDQQPDGSDPTREMIFGILREGSLESENTLRKKTSILLEKLPSLQVQPGEDTISLGSQKKELERKVAELQRQLDDEMKQRMKLETSQGRPKAGMQRLEIELEESKEECSRLKELYEKKKNELSAMSQELMEVRMGKEQVETKLRTMEDKLMDSKEELSHLRAKGGTSPDKLALLKELEEVQDELDEVLQIRQKQEELLRQKDRELTALKGALKDEVANHDKDLDRVREQYQNDMQQLRKNMDNVSQDQLSLESERQKINQVVRNLQRELEESSDEISQWKEMFQKNKEELRSTKQELLQMKLEKEESEDELKETRDRFSLLQSELAQVKKGSVDPGEVASVRKELQRVQDQLKQLSVDKQKVEENLQQREREMSALKGTLKEEVSGRDRETVRLREQLQSEVMHVKKENEGLAKESRRIQDQLKQVLLEKQRHEETVHQRERELSVLKGALKDEVSGRDRETEKLRERLEQDALMTKRSYEELVKINKRLESEKTDLERVRQVIENNLQESREENDDLRRKILGLEAQLKETNTFCDDLQRAESRLKDKINKLEAERKRMEDSLGEVADQEQELAFVKRDLESKLDEAQRSLKRLSLEYEELQECYQEEMKQKDHLKKTKNELEEQKRLLDKSMDKLTRELDNMSNESRGSLQLLQTQLEEYREKSRKEIGEAQKQAKEKTAEAERHQFNSSRMQEEVQKLKLALQELQVEKETVELDKQMISQRLQSLEQDIESKKRVQDDRSRQVKVLEDKLKRMEAELDEEKNTVELLTDRVNRSRDQMEQQRAELNQERSRGQDLECDKISLERQNKELKNRLASMEGQQKPSVNVSHLEAKLQEIQERLQLEEREKATLLSTNRKLERKLKELNIQLEDERLQVNDQKDQLNLRVKALKRQVDEAEEEIERLEGLRKKAVREMEEQQEINEQLQTRVKVMEKESKRKPIRPAHDDDLSSDGEFGGPYDPSSITSLLTESNLQTSSC